MKIKNTVIIILVMLLGISWVGYLKWSKYKEDLKVVVNDKVSEDAEESLSEFEKEKRFLEELHADETFSIEKALSYKLPVFITYGSESCQPCREMEKNLKIVLDKYKGKAIIKKVDIDKYQDKAIGLPIRVVPTTLMYDKNGKAMEIKKDDGGFIQYVDKNDKSKQITVYEGSMSVEQIEDVLKRLGVDK